MDTTLVDGEGLGDLSEEELKVSAVVGLAEVAKDEVHLRNMIRQLLS